MYQKKNQKKNAKTYKKMKETKLNTRIHVWLAFSTPHRTLFGGLKGLSYQRMFTCLVVECYGRPIIRQKTTFKMPTFYILDLNFCLCYRISV